jgi:hypothetical protein
VHLSYRLLEEQMRQYQQYAEQVGTRPPMANDFRQSAESVFRFYEGMYRLWANMFMGFTGFPMWGGGPPGAGGPATGFGYGQPGQGYGQPGHDYATDGFSIELQSSNRRVQTSIDLQVQARGRELIVREVVSGSATLPGVMFERRPGQPLTVHLMVPDDQAPGRYHGMILDAGTQQPCGSITVTIGT